MRFDEPNKIISNVLNDEEIAKIYDEVENRPNNTYLMEHFSQVVTDFDLEPSLYNKFVSIAEESSGIKNLKIAAYQFARYKNYKTDSGEDTVPILSPHWDDAFTTPRLTFDYQMGGNTTWGITVEGKTYTLQNNEAITFGGTHQVHWRPHKIFTNDEYIDMVFIHLDQIGAEEIDPNNPEMQDRQDKWSQVYVDDCKGLVDFYGPAINVKNLEYRHNDKGIKYGATTNNH